MNMSQSKTPSQRAFLSRKEFNPFLKNAWLLMGKAQFQQGDFVAAASTFAYIARFYAPEPLVANEARIWLARAYAHLGWFYDAEDALRRTAHDSLSKKTLHEKSLTMVDFLIRQEKLVEALPHLKNAIKQAQNRQEKARLYYLMAQLHIDLQQKAEAYHCLEKCMAQNPQYELSVHARVLQTEVAADNKDVQTQLNRLQSMVVAEKNKHYTCLIYQAIGNLQLLQGDTLRAIEAYEKGRYAETTAPTERALLLVKLGELYWLQSRYDKAQSCYTTALGMMDKNRAGYKAWTARSQLLDAVAPIAEKVFATDSTLALAAAPEAVRWAVIDEAIKQYKQQQKKQAQARTDSMAQGQSNEDPENTMQIMPEVTPRPRTHTERVWYFYNPMVVAQGKEAFRRQWGRRKNEDDWRRSNKSVVASLGEKNFDYAADDSINALILQHRDSLVAAGVEEKALKEKVRLYAESLIRGEQDNTSLGATLPKGAENDPTQRAYYLAQLPLTPEQKAEAYATLQTALHEMGTIFKEDNKEYAIAQQIFARLEREFPAYEKINDVLYQQFLLAHRLGQEERKQHYKNRLIADFPTEERVQQLLDPNFERNASWAVEWEDSLYTATYYAYLAGDVKKVIQNFEHSTASYVKGANRPKFMLVHALATLNTVARDSSIAHLQRLLTHYPQHEVAEMAGFVLKGLQEGKTIRSNTFALGTLGEKRMQEAKSIVSTLGKSAAFTTERKIPFVLLLRFSEKEVTDNTFVYELSRFNFANFTARGFDLVKEKQGGEVTLQLMGFRTYEDVHTYVQHLYANDKMAQLLHKSKVVMISEKNLPHYETTYTAAQYESFFEKHFAPLKIKKSLPLEFEPTDKERPQQIYEDELPQPAEKNEVQESSDSEGEYYEDDEAEYYDL